MKYTDDEKAIVFLCACTPFEYHERAAILRAVKQPSLIFDADEKFFGRVIKKEENGLYKDVFLHAKEKAERFLSAEEEKGRFCVTVVSADYPEALTQISDPPFVLFGAGNRELLKERKIAIVGSRIIPPWAEATGREIAEELSARFAVVTGLAEGGDSAAIAGALQSGKLICVLPNGLDECYPASHANLKERVRKKGLLLSECLPGEKVRKYSFHARNRLLAGLSEGVLVLSAGAKSGTLITANRALEYGRDVFALPHNANVKQGEGCNALIKAGAYLVTEAKDILQNYGFTPEKRTKETLSVEEKKVLSALRDGDKHITEIAEETGMRIYEASALLTALEMKNLVVRAGANRYSALG